MSMPFLKMNGLGNDFVVIDARKDDVDPPAPALIRAIADRRLGVGCDQLIVLSHDKDGADALMRIWNPDGSQAEACGNATRCVAAVLGKEAGKREIGIRTVAGLLECRLLDDGRVQVDMGEPQLDWRAIPLAQEQDTRRLDIRVGPVDPPELEEPAAVNIGNPHCVFFVEDVTKHDIEQLGPLLEHHPLFPERANVNFAQVKGPGRIRLRVWERGTGVTPACGSGACATAVAAVRRALTERRVVVEVDGGELEIEWTPEGRVLMTGPVALAFAGTFDEGWLSEYGGGAGQ